MTPVTFYPCCEHCEPYPRHVYGDAGEPNLCELAGVKDAHRTPCRGTWECRL